MKRPPIEKLRRLALVGAVTVGLVLAATYGWRRWQAYEARRGMKVELAADVEQQAEKFSVSRSEEGRTLFTVQASRTIERTGKTTVLENVVATIHGRRGDRADEIRTERCEYDQGGTGEISCPGEVRVTLRGSAPSRGLGTPAGGLELTTSRVRFDTAKGEAWTDERVRFVFSGGTGEGVGLRYQAEEPAVQLQSQVDIHLTGVRVEGAQLHYYAGSRTLELLPPLSLRSERGTLTAERVRTELDPEFRAQRVEAEGRVRVQGQQQGRAFTLSSPRAVALYAADGSLRELEASQGVEVTRRGGDTEESLTSREAVLTFAAGDQVDRVKATGDARLVTRAPRETRELRAPTLELAYGPPARTRQRLVAGPRGTLVVRRPEGEERTLTADRIEMEFENEQRLRSLAGSGDVQTESRRPNGARQKTASDELRARFDDDGNVAEAEQWGRFRYDGDRWHAQAGRADYRGAGDTYLLREQPAFWDSTTRTTARVIEINDKAGKLGAEGDVRSTRRSASPGQQGSPADSGGGEPVHFASERLQADRDRNWARYEGQARMWGGQNRLAADAIELFQDERKLVARGNVSGLFFEAAKEEKKAEAGKPDGPKPDGQKPAAAPRGVTVTSARFTYWEAEHRGLFEEDVKARNDFGLLTAPRLEVFLGAGAEGGSESLERARAEGGVLIEQPDGQATSEQAEYRAGEQTVTLTGGPPKVVDAERGTVTGAQLTLFLSDGTIRVNSDEGTRTVTRRRWTR